MNRLRFYSYAFRFTTYKPGICIHIQCVIHWIFSC